MLVKTSLLSCPPWYCPIPGGDMIVKYFHYHVGSYVSKNTRGGDTIRLLIKLIVMCNTGGGHDSKIFSLPSGWPGTGKYIGGTSI